VSLAVCSWLGCNCKDNVQVQARATPDDDDANAPPVASGRRVTDHGSRENIRDLHAYKVPPTSSRVAARKCKDNYNERVAKGPALVVLAMYY
jgi:hypothetical protein